MDQPPQWRRGASPDGEIVSTLEKALEAAKGGHVRAVSVVIVNPLHEVEVVSKGDLDGVCRHAMIGGLSSAAHKLLQKT